MTIGLNEFLIVSGLLFTIGFVGLLMDVDSSQHF